MVTSKRGSDSHRPKDNMKVGLPYRPFLFTIDQIAGLLNIAELTLSQRYLYYEGRSTGFKSHDLMVARNIAPRDRNPDWRVAERELIRWMKRKGFKHYEPVVLEY